MAYVLGTTGDDDLDGTGADDLIEGLDGDDILDGLGGDDELLGGEGDDILEGGLGSDILNGGAAFDIASYRNAVSGLTLNLQTNVLTGEAVGDTWISIEGFWLSEFADVFVGATSGSVGETVYGWGGADSLSGGGGNDILHGGDGDDTLVGGSGTDTLIGGLGADAMSGDSNDTVSYQFATTGLTLDRRTGTQTGEALGDTFGFLSRFRLTDFADTGRTGENGGTIYGGGGDDTLEGGSLDEGDNYDGSRADFLYGEDGNDTLTAGDEWGASLLGGIGDDIIHGGRRNDYIEGGDGDDQIFLANTLPGALSNGTDQVSGGAGYDTVSFAGAGYAVSVSLTAGSPFTNDIENWILTDQNDTFTGGPSFNDTVDGGGGDDRLIGAFGSDLLMGGDGNDWLIGGGDGDTLQGGDGIDTASYEGSGAVQINLALGTATGSHAAGDVLTGIENLRGSNSADTLIGDAGDNVIEGGQGGDTLDGGGGFNTLSYSTSSLAVTVNLALNTASGGDAAGDVISNFSAVIGSAFGNDTLTGSAANETFEGGGGADTLDGGLGFDTLIYSGSTSGVTINLALNTASGGQAQGDVISNFEAVTGSAYDDRLTGKAGVNVILGGAGNDIIEGGDGADTLDGGEGIDTVSYAGSNGHVRIRLFAGTAQFGDAGGDMLTGFENIIGSAHNDQLSGDTGDNIIEGGAGADLMGGREGFDTLSYASSSARVIINLSNGTASGGDATGDSFNLFEAVLGSAYNDILNGGNGDQTIEGGLGNDQMNGGNGYDTLSYQRATNAVTVNLLAGTATGMGNDTVLNFDRVLGSDFNDSLTGDAGDNTLVGGLGNDQLNGGDGSDTADYSASTSGVNISLITGLGSGGHAAGDTLSNIENVTGSAYGDTLRGNASANLLIGGDGADRLYGEDGTDTASYAGSDAGVTVSLLTGLGAGGHAEGDTLESFENLIGSAFDDVLTGNAGINEFVGGAGADTIDGQGGRDWVSYATSSKVTVNLTTGLGARGDATGDVLTSIENVRGSQFSDLIYGSADMNVLLGLAGNDTLQGRGGDDVIDGGAGNDRLNGGSGGDLFVFSGASGADTIQDFAVGEDRIRLDPGLFTDFADVQAHTTDDGLGNTVIAKGGISIILTGVLEAQLSSGDFEFAGPPYALRAEIKDDPLILPDGLEAKGLAEDGPVICPPGEGLQTPPDPVVPPADDAEISLMALAETSFITRLMLTAYPERTEWTDWIT